MTSVGTVTGRIVAIADDITGITASDVYPDDLVAVLPLPFCFVEEGPATFRKSDSNNIKTTQEWSLLLYVQQFETEKTGQEDAAFQAVRQYLNSVPLYFWKRTRLQRNDQGLTDVESASLTAHESIQSASRNNREYMGVAFTLSVVYDQYVEET